MASITLVEILLGPGPIRVLWGTYKGRLKTKGAGISIFLITLWFLYQKHYFRELILSASEIECYLNVKM